MRILVTGGGGFLGRAIAEQLLERGDRVRLFARGEYPHLAALGVECVRGDLQDAAAVDAACRKIDLVFHVAAKAGFWGSWESYYEPNVIGTRHVIAACRNQGVRKLVFTSSPSVVFDGNPQEGLDETTPYPQRYENHYSATKAIAERMALEANRNGLLTTCLRPHLIWGPRDTQIMPRLLALARRGLLPQVGEGRNRVDLTYIADAARAHLLAADALEAGSLAAGAVYFISQDEPVNLWQWIDELLARLSMPAIRLHVPLWAARAVGGLMEMTYRTLPLRGEPRLTRFLASELAMSHYYDIRRAKNDLGYKPRYTMAQALDETIPWLLEQGGKT